MGVAHRRRPTDPRPRRSKAWDIYLRETGLGHLIVPEDQIEPLIGRACWTPAHEMPDAAPVCSICLGQIEANPDGPSNRYCPKCQASGFDHRLRQQRLIKPDPRPDPRPRPPMPCKVVSRKKGRPKRVSV